MRITNLLALAATATAVSVTVQSGGGNATSPYQYGIMFEDINNSGDGGVYAELVQNRAFQGDEIFPKSLSFWAPLGGAQLSLQNLSNPLSAALPTSMQVSGNSGDGTIGFQNLGFWGFPVVSGWTYKGSFYVLGDFDGNITASLVSNSTGTAYASANVEVTCTSGEWSQFTYTFQPSTSAPDSNNTLNFEWDASGDDGDLNFNLISLFPPTYNNRENGLRIDLLEALGGLKPSAFRVPGGNNIEGLQSPYWWNWTETLGPLKDRPGFPGTWSYENTNGLGLLEYMLWAEDLGTEVVLAVWAGLWLDGETVPEDELQTYVQSALDELEFLTGSKSTTWGAYRASLGRSEPFSVKFVEIGNEDSLNNGSTTYSAYRFTAFYNAISSAYPNITIIASYYDVGPVTPLGKGTAGDFHEYALPSLMASQFTFFDNYTDEHPLLLGEYAVLEYDASGVNNISYDNGAPRAPAPFWYGSVAEAVYLLGAERNSDKIISAMYAPTFQNQNRWEWLPDMISYDANPAHTVLSTSYEMVRLLSGTRITENLPMDVSDGVFGPAYWVAGRSADTGSHILKAAVYNSTASVPFSVTFQGVSSGAQATLTYITAPYNSSNNIGSNVVETRTSDVTADSSGAFSFSLPDWSVAVFEVTAEEAGYGSKARRHGWKGCRHW